MVSFIVCYYILTKSGGMGTMYKKKICCILLATSLVLVNTSIIKADELQDARQKYMEYQKLVDERTAEVVKFNSEIESSLSQIEQNNKEISQLNAEIESTSKAIATLEEEIEAQENVKDKRVRELYKSGGGASYLTLLFDSNGLKEFFSKLDITKRLVDIDKKIVDDIENSKEELARRKVEQDEKMKGIKKLNDEINKEMSILEEKKSEQQTILDSIQAEQNKFSADVLDVAEREVVQPQYDLIASSWDDLNGLNSAINQLIAVRDNQLVSPTVIQEVTDKIAEAYDRSEELKAYQYNIPNRGVSDATGNSIVDYAYQFLGSPYVWGAVGPYSFDCSGFTSYVYRHAAGMEITRTTYTQINVGVPVSYDEMQPGDLVFTYNNEHVGIYVGNGQYINATYPGSTVRVTPVTSFYAARRLL